MNIAPPTSGPSELSQSLKSGLNNAGNYLDSIKSTASNTFNDFSNQAQVGSTATTQYLSSNTAVAKFAFLILILIVFVFLIGLGITLISYFTSPYNNPYLISGMVDGSTPITVFQDPKQQKSVPIMRSNNQNTGLEFTWSIWLLINDLGDDVNKYQHIFSKGNNTFDTTTGLATVNNAPGLYLTPNNNTLHIIVDSNNPTDVNTVIDVSNIPLRKWVHVAIRVQNTIVDVYINGTVAKRLLMINPPKQNYNDVYVCNNNGFSGKISDLRYFSRALNVFDINSIIAWGPNTSPGKVATVDKSAQNIFNGNYLSDAWYNFRGDVNSVTL
jgi:hypothetical protein